MINTPKKYNFGLVFWHYICKLQFNFIYGTGEQNILKSTNICTVKSDF